MCKLKHAVDHLESTARSTTSQLQSTTVNYSQLQFNCCELSALSCFLRSASSAIRLTAATSASHGWYAAAAGMGCSGG